MMVLRASCVALALALALVPVLGSEAQASRLLYLDAATPGATPGSSWKDLSTTGYNFTPSGGVTYVSADKAFSLDGSNGQLTGGAAETPFEFDTGKGGASNAFSVVLYFKSTATGDSPGQALLAKETASAIGWDINPRFSTNSNTTIDVVLAHDTGGSRTFWRNGSFGTTTGWHLLTATFDGGGDVSGVKVYVDGNLLSTTYTENTLHNSILNNVPLVIGHNPLNGAANFFTGEVGIVEVWNNVLTQTDVTARWNGGLLVRSDAVPEPGLTALALISLASLRRRSRSRA